MMVFRKKQAPSQRKSGNFNDLDYSKNFRASNITGSMSE